MTSSHVAHHSPASLASCVVVRIDSAEGTVTGIACSAQPITTARPNDSRPVALERFVAATFTNESETSLAIAEVASALGRPASIAVVADLSRAQSGPADGTREMAEQLATTTGQAVYFTTTPHTGDVVPAAEVDQLVRIIEGTGLAISRLETAATARHRAIGNQKARRKVRGAIIPNSIYEAEVATPEQLAPLIGSALALVNNDTTGDLRPSVVETIAPSAEGAGGLGWAIQPATVPVEFTIATPTDPVELHYTLLAHALSMVALILAAVLL